ncbi:hypothetical protein SAMN04489742_4895 [Arthrobacter crystallopoietes]|uniref:Alcohol dehydrogenase GroES-like domain-containing protein n=1 Tax=Crystallibacter crystallopoietes TaxID=37928 RepID=A0A1H1I1U9_9MICC|nr:hypothetical protein SAMN04489742_4895 [Arthrobacter crystallopoietes]
MGDIADRTKERLGTSDAAIILPGDACSQQWTAWKTRPSRYRYHGPACPLNVDAAAQRHPVLRRCQPGHPSGPRHRLRFHLDRTQQEFHMQDQASPVALPKGPGPWAHPSPTLSGPPSRCRIQQRARDDRSGPGNHRGRLAESGILGPVRTDLDLYQQGLGHPTVMGHHVVGEIVSLSPACSGRGCRSRRQSSAGGIPALRTGQLQSLFTADVYRFCPTRIFGRTAPGRDARPPRGSGLHGGNAEYMELSTGQCCTNCPGIWTQTSLPGPSPLQTQSTGSSTLVAPRADRGWPSSGPATTVSPR